MRIAYDVQADALTLAFGEAEVEVSRELAPDLIVNLDRGQMSSPWRSCTPLRGSGGGGYGR